jgi:hypothetical protein
MTRDERSDPRPCELTPARALRLCERYRELVPLVAALRQRRIEVAEIFAEAQGLGDRPDAYGIRAPM